MKNRIIALFLTGELENHVNDIKEKLNQVRIEINEIKTKNSAEDIHTLSETRSGYVTELLRLKLATPERIQSEINSIKAQCRTAESNYEQFDADEQNLGQKISLLINWGKLIVTARTCGIERVGETDRFRKEALALHKQIAPKRGTSSSNTSAEVWTSFLAEVFKIFAKLKIDEKHTVMFLQHSLVDSFSLM